MTTRSFWLVALILITLAGAAPASRIASAQQSNPSSGREPDPHPANFKVYSAVGRESLTATCSAVLAASPPTPAEENPVISQVMCKFIHVRFNPPDQRDLRAQLEEALKDRLATQEDRERLWSEVVETHKREGCAPSSKERAAIEANSRDPNLGPKLRTYYQRLLTACANKDPQVFFKQSFDAVRRTCSLWVDTFSLPFKRIGRGQWLYRQETPGGLSKALKVYELTRSDGLWNLAETRVPTAGSDEKVNQTLWSWKNQAAYELPCDFISHDLVQFQW